MSGTPTTRPPARQADPAFEQQLREMNEALLLSAVRQQELAEQVEKAHAVVRESEERYHTLFDLVPVAVYSCVMSGVIQTFNRRAAELWGREPVLGDTDERFCGSFRLFRPDGSLMPHDQCPMAEVLSGKIAGVRDAEVLIERPDGSRVSVIVNIHPLKNQRGEVTGAINCFYDVTERKQAEAVNATLAAIIQSSDDAIISKTLDGIITSWNKSAEKMFGYTEAEAVGQNITLIIPEERRLEEDNVLACLRRDEKIENFQTDRQTKDGRRLDISMTVSPIKTAAGQIIGASKIARDITERKRVQDALWETEHRLRFVMDSAPQKIFTAQPDGKVDYFNPQWTEFTGLSFEQINGWGWKQFIHPADLDENVRLWQHSIDTGEPFQFERRFRRAHGEYRWHVSRAVPMRDDAGQITMWVGSDTDVHDIKQAQVALHDSEVRYRRLFETSRDGVLILGFSNGRIIDVNPFMRELLGYSNDEFLGKELWEIGLFSDKAASESTVQELQKTGYLRFEHLPLKSKDGRLVEVEVVANAYQEDHHSVIQFNIRDITERSRMEAVLREQAVQLSELHRRKDEFLAMLSHELRSPLAPIANAVQLLGLQKSGESRIQQQARGIIERQVGQLQHLVDDLLEVSRISTGRVQLRLKRVDMCRIAEGAVETVRPLIEQRRHELTVSLPQEPVWMVADAARLEQVLVNLLTNASKYTEGGGHIWLTVEVVAAESGEWRVESGEKKSGEWRVTSGEKAKSGEWRVESGEKEKAVGDRLPIPDLTTHHSSLTTSAFSHDRAALPGTQSLAGSDEPGRALLPGDEKFPQGGTVRVNQPDSPSGSVGASQHRGGARTPAHEGIPELSERGEKKSGEWRVASDEKVEESDHATPLPPLTTPLPPLTTPLPPLTTHHSPLATHTVVIRVRDTGVGISPALLPHIFDLFTQADRSLDRSQGGLGIGLALVQRLTELHGGKVEAFSTMGEGSEFVVRLPVMSDEWRVASGENAATSSLTTHHSPLATPLRVLVVDDNVDTVLGFSMLLKATGHDVRTAHDGLSAVEAAIDYRPDVVLLDIGLPGLNGYEVAKRLRQHPNLKHTVLIALTGYGQDTDRQTSQQAGFDHHLVKPARFEQLKKILATVQEGLKL